MDNTQKSLLRKISGVQFAFIECCMFLDTHPDDAEAQSKAEMYREKLKTMIKQYEDSYGPLTLSSDFGNDGFDWINDPWPWEKEAN